MNNSQSVNCSKHNTGSCACGSGHCAVDRANMKAVASPVDDSKCEVESLSLNGQTPEIPMNELKINTWNPISTGFVTRQDTHVSITHLATRIYVESSDERSVHRARAVAMEKFEAAWAEHWSKPAMNNREEFEALRDECAKVAEQMSSDYPESAIDTAEAIRAIDLSKFALASQSQQKKEELNHLELREFLECMQNGEMTVSRGLELIDLWLYGKYSNDMLPDYSNQPTPIEQLANAMQRQADMTAKYIALSKSQAQQENHDELTLRRLLCMVYSGSNAYTDDGELQDNAAQLFIDFKRDSVCDLQKKLHSRLVNGLTKLSPALEGNKPCKQSRIAQLEAELTAIKQQFINYENADEYALDSMLEYANLQALIMSIKEQQ